jgi:hypothetical protein
MRRRKVILRHFVHVFASCQLAAGYAKTSLSAREYLRGKPEKRKTNFKIPNSMTLEKSTS